MPIYEYRCKSCGARFELFVRTMGAMDHAVCPECGTEEVTKEWSVFGLGRGGDTASGRVGPAASTCLPAST
ncbi:MAG TPA: zinc ribbon domain-containing protein [Anaerolineae bacterium]|nr:zinc ribbon domain-containing protein [Anaerolineae bacterium]